MSHSSCQWQWILTETWNFSLLKQGQIWLLSPPSDSGLYEYGGLASFSASLAAWGWETQELGQASKARGWVNDLSLKSIKALCIASIRKFRNHLSPHSLLHTFPLCKWVNYRRLPKFTQLLMVRCLDPNLSWPLSSLFWAIRTLYDLISPAIL